MAPPFGHQEADLWSLEELDKLFVTRTAHAALSWPEFHAMNFFPGRTQSSLMAQWRRMGLTRDLPLTGHKHRQSNAIATGKRDMSKAGIDASGGRGKGSKGTEAVVHNDNGRGRPHKRRRSVWSVESSSSDPDAGDIDHHGHISRLRSPSSSQRTPTPQPSLTDKGAGEPSSQRPDRVSASQQIISRPSSKQSKSIEPTPNTQSSQTPESVSASARGGKKTQLANTTSEDRAETLQTQQSASSTSSQPTSNAEPKQHNQNDSASAVGASNGPPTAQRRCKSVTAPTPSVSEPPLPNRGPRQSTGADEGEREESLNSDVDFMVMVPMPKPHRPCPPAQGAASANPVERHDEAEEPGTATELGERTNPLDQPRLLGKPAEASLSSNTTPKPNILPAGERAATSLSKDQDRPTQGTPRRQALPRDQHKPCVISTPVPPPATLTPTDIDKSYHTGMEAIRSGTRNLEGYYSAINDQQAAETKLLKEANQGLQSMIFELSTENAGLKRQVAENNEELVKLREVKERWEQNAQNLGKIASACRTIEELASLMSAAHEES